MHSSFTESLSCFWRFQGNKSLGGGKALSQNSKIPFPRCSHVLPAPPCQDLGKSSSTLVGRSPVCPPAALPSPQDFWKHRQRLGLIGISPAPLRNHPQKRWKREIWECCRGDGSWIWICTCPCCLCSAANTIPSNPHFLPVPMF